MSPSELLPEIWARVISHLRKDLPTPTGKHKLSAIRQDSLCKVARCSKLFHSLATPHLYKIVVCDHLPSLVYNLTQPSAAKGIKSKAELLSLIERLFLEYCDKGEPSYLTLMAHGGDFFNLTQPNVKEVLKVCGDETDWIADAAGKLQDVPKALRTLSTGAFCGNQKTYWRGIFDGDIQHPSVPNMPQRIIRAGAAITSLATTHRRMAYFCHRIEYGPLTYITVASDGMPAQPGWKGAPSLQHRVHMDDHPGMIPAIPGGDSRWYCTLKNVTGYTDIHAACGYISQKVAAHIEGREIQLRQVDPAILAKMARAGKGTALSVDMYFPPRFMVPDIKDFFRLLVDSAVEGKSREMGMPKSRLGKDVINFKKLASAP